MGPVRRPRRPSPRVVDALVLLVVGVPTLLDAWWNQVGTRQADALTYGLALVAVGSLWFRRTHAVAVAGTSGVAATALALLGHRGELLALPVAVALYHVATTGNRRRTVVCGAVAATWSGAVGLLVPGPIGAPQGTPALEILWPLVALLLGEAVRAHRELAARAAVDVERESARRVAEDRVRVARDVHDVVGHTLVAVNVQLAAADAAFDDDPEAARGALRQARESCGEALADLRCAVRSLRDGGEARLDALARLVAAGRTGGVDVVVHDERDGLVVPPSVDGAAYRIVQEALTNVVRHARAPRADVRLAREDGRLVVEVVDAGGPGGGDAGPDAAPDGGFGLLGMRERALALGGTFEHGPLAGGGFRVRAVLPVEAPS